MPHTVERGNTAVLQCRYHVLHNSFDDTLYSLKWYKDEVEFYRLATYLTKILYAVIRLLYYYDLILQVSALEHQRKAKSV